MKLWNLSIELWYLRAGLSILCGTSIDRINPLHAEVIGGIIKICLMLHPHFTVSLIATDVLVTPQCYGCKAFTYFKLIWGHIQIALHFLSPLDSEMAKVVEIHPHWRQGIPPYAWLLLAWLLTSPGHQQPWYWPSSEQSMYMEYYILTRGNVPIFYPIHST